MEKARVYFTKTITPEAVITMYRILGKELPGKVAVKVHSGEQGNQNYLRPEFLRPMIEAVQGTVVECNTAYPEIEFVQIALNYAQLGLSRLDRVLLRPRLPLGAPLLPLLPQPFGGPGPFALLVQFSLVPGLMDTVSRAGPGLTHLPCPPAWSSGGCKARCPGGSGPQRGWWCPHKKAAPRRSRNG